MIKRILVILIFPLVLLAVPVQIIYYFLLYIYSGEDRFKTHIPIIFSDWANFNFNTKTQK